MRTSHTRKRRIQHHDVGSSPLFFSSSALRIGVIIAWIAICSSSFLEHTHTIGWYAEAFAPSTNTLRRTKNHRNRPIPPRFRSDCPHVASSIIRESTALEANGGNDEKQQQPKRSRITSIRCENFAGMTSGDNGVVELNLDASESATTTGNLVCITGETGSGKSLLVSKIADLLKGGKASASLLHSNNNNDGEESDQNNKSTTAEMVLSLHEPAHISFLDTTLRQMGLDPAVLLSTETSNGVVSLRLKRIISASTRLKSSCFINDHLVPLKALKAIATPLIAIVNAPVAALALGKPSLRLSMIDTGIPPTVLQWVHRLQKTYRGAKQHRQSLERELKNQVRPASMAMGGDEDEQNEEQIKLLKHWIEELDGFERRITEFKASLGIGEPSQIGEAELGCLLQDLEVLEWNKANDDDDASSSLYERVLDLHEYLKALDARIGSAVQARESLASLSSPDSARTALDRTRQLLLDASGQSGGSSSSSSSSKSKIEVATERAHDLLNLVEDALLECSNFMDDDEKGLVARLKASRRACPIDTEELLGYITEWNTLARKHGVPPYQLPMCHATLKNELDGGIEAGRLLPEAKLAEQKALRELEEGCSVLTEARTKLCRTLSASISARLPRLGMENSRFEARLSPITKPSYSNAQLGADEVDFYLLHTDKTKSTQGGKIETVASSGEKARILLAIECEIPGSISAIGGGTSSTTPSTTAGDNEDDPSPKVSPLAVIYDEIDAHVGGRASISVAQMLFDQSKACQVLSITHSPSLAAIADTHIRVHRGSSRDGRSFDVVAGTVDGVERRKELARMASGDMVADEAELFAEALLRDASSIKAEAQNLPA